MSRTIRIGLVSILAVVVACELLARLVVGAADPAATRWYDVSAELKIDQMDNLESANTVVVGTSMAWQGLVPHGLDAGGTSYNAGLAGGVPQVMEPWLLDEVVPRLKPTTVVWGLASLDLSASYGEQNFNTYDDALETKPGWLADVDRAASSVSVLIRDRQVLRDPSRLFGDERDTEQQRRLDAPSILGADGERLDFEENTGANRRLTLASRLRDYQIDVADVEAILRVGDALAEQGISLVLVALPMPPRMVAEHPRGEQDAATTQRTIALIGEDLGVPVLFPTEVFSDSDFVDYTHLNADGAARLSADIGDQLTSN